ncbi:hypothetical protein BKA70DRAFT_861185 [Coprinopsis sp. MPI-PUGE-AT-0042]|nr:hypothetical protein BKA70DRAFT_861185 [Coprinopsis sp. MPI-PUGE-AT-0042]
MFALQRRPWAGLAKSLPIFRGFLAPGHNLACILTNRGRTVEEGEGINWAIAEALAFRLLTLVPSAICPPNHLCSSQAKFVVCNPLLSDFGCLGLELGYSLVSRNALTIWWAHFGNFPNSAQVIIDQYIVARERKWLQCSNLIVSPTCGFDGQGPEAFPTIGPV